MKKIIAGWLFVFFVLCAGYFLVRYEAISLAKDSEYSPQIPLGIEGELWVSPYGIEDKLINRMLASKYSMQMWFYRISRDQAEQVMKNLSRVWVDIAWIGENKPYEWIDKAFLKTAKRMQNAGITVTDDKHLWLNFNHAKVIIADKKRFLLATANLTYSSIRRNREYRFTSDHEWVTQSLVSLFEDDLKWKKTDIDSLDPNLILCPENCRTLITKMIDESKKSLDISVQYLQDKIIRDLLISKAKEIDLRILVWFWQNEWRLNEFPEWVVKILPDPYLHTKNILIDDSLLIHGSMNMSENSLDNNREIGIIISDDSAIRSFSRQFSKDREEGVLFKERNFSD